MSQANWKSKRWWQVKGNEWCKVSGYDNRNACNKHKCDIILMNIGIESHMFYHANVCYNC